MELSYDERGKSQIEPVSGWISREELERECPGVRDLGSHVFCNSCGDKWKKALKKETEKLKREGKK